MLPFSALYVEGLRSSHGPSGGRSSALRVAIALIGCLSLAVAFDRNAPHIDRRRVPPSTRRLREKPRIGRTVDAREVLTGDRSMPADDDLMVCPKWPRQLWACIATWRPRLSFLRTCTQLRADSSNWTARLVRGNSRTRSLACIYELKHVDCVTRRLPSLGGPIRLLTIVLATAFSRPDALTSHADGLSAL